MEGFTSTMMQSFYNNSKINDLLEGNFEQVFEFDEGVTAILNGAPAVSFEDVGAISNSQATELGKLLMKNKTLEQLDLRDSNIKTPGALAIAHGLKFNKTLWQLNLSNNNIDEDGGLQFLEVLKLNTTLQELNLKKNYCDEILKDIAKQLQVNRKKNTTNWEGFVEALEQGDKGPWNMAKLMVVGQGRAGKTATVRSLLGQGFQQTESTVGVELTRTKVAAKGASWEKELTQEADFMNNVAARIAMTKTKALNDKSSSQYVKKKKKKPKKRKKHKVPRKDNLIDEYIISTETFVIEDSKQNLVDKEEIAQRYNEKLFLNPEDTITYTIWDYGGQTVFYTLHHLFLTRYGVYLLVFDLREVLQNPSDAKNYLKFWLNSIDLHAADAPILLIGTFHDVVKGKRLREVEKELSTYVKQFDQIVSNKAEKLNFFPLDNTLGNTSNIRQTIESVTKEQEYINNEVSLRWLHCLDKFLGDSTKSYFTFSETRNIGNDLGVVDEAEHENMLKLFHQLGVIIYFTATQALRDIVVTNPQWLIDCLGQVIRDPEFHRRNPQSLRKYGLEEDDKLLFEEGIVTRDLLNHLWPSGKMDFFLDLMRRTLLLSDWKFDGSGASECFLVPSMISKQNAFDLSSAEGLRCDFDFTAHYLPTGVFQRLVCLLVAHSAAQSLKTTPKLFKKSAKIFFPDSTIQIFEGEDHIYAYIEPKNEQGTSKALRILISSMHKLDVDSMGSGLVWDVLLESKDTLVPYATAKKSKLAPWFTSGLKPTAESSRQMRGVDLDTFLQSM